MAFFAVGSLGLVVVVRCWRRGLRRLISSWDFFDLFRFRVVTLSFKVLIALPLEVLLLVVVLGFDILKECQASQEGFAAFVVEDVAQGYEFSGVVPFVVAG
jgi:dolichyl-phosphate-mannose--protein O-mannosyl transferase